MITLAQQLSHSTSIKQASQASTLVDQRMGEATQQE